MFSVRNLQEHHPVRLHHFPRQYSYDRLHPRRHQLQVDAQTPAHWR